MFASRSCYANIISLFFFHQFNIQISEVLFILNIESDRLLDLMESYALLGDGDLTGGTWLTHNLFLHHWPCFPGARSHSLVTNIKQTLTDCSWQQNVHLLTHHRIYLCS